MQCTFYYQAYMPHRHGKEGKESESQQKRIYSTDRNFNSATNFSYFSVTKCCFRRLISLKRMVAYSVSVHINFKDDHSKRNYKDEQVLP